MKENLRLLVFRKFTSILRLNVVSDVVANKKCLGSSSLETLVVYSVRVRYASEYKVPNEGEVKRFGQGLEAVVGI